MADFLSNPLPQKVGRHCSALFLTPAPLSLLHPRISDPSPASAPLVLRTRLRTLRTPHPLPWLHWRVSARGMRLRKCSVALLLPIAGYSGAISDEFASTGGLQDGESEKARGGELLCDGACSHGDVWPCDGELSCSGRLPHGGELSCNSATPCGGGMSHGVVGRLPRGAGGAAGCVVTANGSACCAAARRSLRCGRGRPPSSRGRRPSAQRSAHLPVGKRRSALFGRRSRRSGNCGERASAFSLHGAVHVGQRSGEHGVVLGVRGGGVA